MYFRGVTTLQEKRKRPMFLKQLQDKATTPIKQKAGSFLLHQADRYTRKIREDLDACIDKRLVGTFFNLFVIILMFRERRMGLLLSELGGYLCGHSKAPAGTKRISNLLRSKKWTSSMIDDHFFESSVERIASMVSSKKRPLLLWDDSRVEKHESWVCEGLCSVWSSKAKRLTRIRPGFFSPPKQRICVPGFKWTGVFLSCLGQTPSVCQMKWWTTRGKYKEDPDNIMWRLLRKVNERITQPILHVFDRGYASEKVIGYLLNFEQDFIIRWKKNIYLLDMGEKKKIGNISRTVKAVASRIVRDKERKKEKRVTIGWTKIEHPEHPGNQLTLIIIRDKKNYQGPMYLLTSIDVDCPQIAWEMMYTYFHRWEAEQGFRFLKSELGIESPRLWFWDNRMKLMGIVTLVYDFMLQMLRNWKSWIPLFLKNYCHRTGKRYRDASIPLYRLRMAISICLTLMWAQNSG